jgi:inorganic pyrophosphatase
MIGKTVRVIIDRPLGTYHPKHRDIFYMVNYGYVAGIIAPDGEEQDAYVLGIDKPIEEFTGIVLAVIHRLNDVEDKWIVVPEETSFTKEEIIKQVDFQEKYFKIEIRM